MFFLCILGLSTSSHMACPTCGPSLVTERPVHLSKVIYPNNHRFLPTTHERYAPPINGITPFKWTMANWARYWEAHWSASPPPKKPPKGMFKVLNLPHLTLLGVFKDSTSTRSNACVQECFSKYLGPYHW